MISGKEALMALASGQEVQGNIGSEWVDITVDQKLSIKSFITEANDYGCAVKFRLKPRTVNLNGIEVPAPFEPKKSEAYWCFSTQTVIGYGHNVYESEHADRRFMSMGVWRTEEEIKQVVEALRQIFK